MSDHNYMAVPPGSYWEPDDEREQRAFERGEYHGLADAIVESAIEEALLRRAERKRNAAKH